MNNNISLEQNVPIMNQPNYNEQQNASLSGQQQIHASPSNEDSNDIKKHTFKKSVNFTVEIRHKKIKELMEQKRQKGMDQKQLPQNITPNNQFDQDYQLKCQTDYQGGLETLMSQFLEETNLNQSSQNDFRILTAIRIQLEKQNTNSICYLFDSNGQMKLFLARIITITSSCQFLQNFSLQNLRDIYREIQDILYYTIYECNSSHIFLIQNHVISNFFQTIAFILNDTQTNQNPIDLFQIVLINMGNISLYSNQFKYQFMNHVSLLENILALCQHNQIKSVFFQQVLINFIDKIVSVEPIPQQNENLYEIDYSENALKFFYGVSQILFNNSLPLLAQVKLNNDMGSLFVFGNFYQNLFAALCTIQDKTTYETQSLVLDEYLQLIADIVNTSVSSSGFLYEDQIICQASRFLSKIAELEQKTIVIHDGGILQYVLNYIQDASKNKSKQITYQLIKIVHHLFKTGFDLNQQEDVVLLSEIFRDYKQIFMWVYSKISDSQDTYIKWMAIKTLALYCSICGSDNINNLMTLTDNGLLNQFTSQLTSLDMTCHIIKLLTFIRMILKAGYNQMQQGQDQEEEFDQQVQQSYFENQTNKFVVYMQQNNLWVKIEELTNNNDQQISLSASNIIDQFNKKNN